MDFLAGERLIKAMQAANGGDGKAASFDIPWANGRERPFRLHVDMPGCQSMGFSKSMRASLEKHTWKEGHTDGKKWGSGSPFAVHY